MTPEELAGRATEVLVLDVREDDEWEAGHLEGAVHVPVDELDERLDEVPTDRPVVTVCRSGDRSEQAAGRLRAAGVDATSLDGGLLAWAAAGLPLTSDGGEPGTVADPSPDDDRPEEHRQLQDEFLGVLFALRDEIGDREPTEQDVRDFLRRRMTADGRSAEEIDAFFAGLDAPE